MTDEAVKLIKNYLEFLNRVLSPETYLGKFSNEELILSAQRVYSGIVEAWGAGIEFWFRWIQSFWDVEESVREFLRYISKLEDVSAKMSDNPLYSAYVNAINRAYLRYLTTLQNLNSAYLHSLGLVSRKDVIALAEAYVDLKGDIKKETRKLLEEIRKLEREIEELRGEGK